ncbi:hypothetical protein HPB52_011370 [Rhipicephalus sanguineus]|uniref:Uncharacterized protein n=1 Tax=Rhipicephalus sanguineus TaxID=34632 RepID=A0A9D4T9H3_RHISA|nr:hypothetical protein HPB52_011370 [Rhipicephalus sanguineus]
MQASLCTAPQRQKTLPTANRSLSQQPTDAALTAKMQWYAALRRRRSCPFLPPSSPPALPSPQVTALQQENASLRQQLAAQDSLIKAHKTEVASLQAKLSTLEQKLDAALDRLSPLPSSTASSTDMDSTRLRSLHLSEEVQAAIKTAQADFERRLDSRFNSVHQLLKTQHEALNSLHTDLGAFLSAASLQSLQETVDTLHICVLESVRGKLPLHTRASNTASASRRRLLLSQRRLLLSLIMANRSTTSNNLTLQIHRYQAAIKWLIIPHPILLRPSSPGGRSRSTWSIYPSLRAAKSPFLVLGDFNVKHPDWGYPKADGPGTRLGQ